MPEEYWRASLCMSVAFEYAFDWEKEKTKAPKPDPLAEWYGAFLNEEEPPVGAMIINRREVRFDGHVLKMGGVGGVATLPANRRGGAIRACMETALRDLYREGYALSHLYPFSTAYYRQFGFAPAGGQSAVWRVKLKDLRGLPEVRGSVRQLFPGDDLSVLKEIYDRAYADINFSCLRQTFDKRLEGNKPLQEKRWIFVWSDESGTPGAFLVGSRDKDTLHCTPDFSAGDAFLFTNIQSLLGLLNFVRTAFIANFEAIQFTVPAHLEMTALLPEQSGMECRSVLNGMARAVNVETLLQSCLCQGEGHLTLRVSDAILPENNDTFALHFAPGQQNRVERTAAAPDISLDVGNLSVLLGGARTTGSIALTPDITLHHSTPAIGQVFYRKPCHILDLF